MVGEAMKTKQILELDCRIQKNREAVQRALRCIKPLAKCNPQCDVPLDKVEKLVRLMLNKYQAEIVWIFVSHDDENMLYTISLRGVSATEQYQPVYGITLYEVMCKCAIYMWSLVKQGAFEERNQK